MTSTKSCGSQNLDKQGVINNNSKTELQCTEPLKVESDLKINTNKQLITDTCKKDDHCYVTDNFVLPTVTNPIVVLNDFNNSNGSLASNIKNCVNLSVDQNQIRCSMTKADIPTNLHDCRNDDTSAATFESTLDELLWQNPVDSFGNISDLNHNNVEPLPFENVQITKSYTACDGSSISSINHDSSKGRPKSTNFSDFDCISNVDKQGLLNEMEAYLPKCSTTPNSPHENINNIINDPLLINSEPIDHLNDVEAALDVNGETISSDSKLEECSEKTSTNTGELI